MIALIKRTSGFTLVELLIVITIIGILAIAVLSALNPIEQFNKARDTGRKNDAAQLLGAIERYYANHERFPWNTVRSTFTTNSGFFAEADHAQIAVCGGTATAGNVGTATGCPATPVGLLISENEVKAEFGRRNMFKAVASKAVYDRFFVVKPNGSSSVNVCFIPSSSAERADLTKLRTIAQPAGQGEGNNATLGNCTTAPANWDAVTANSCFICVPQ